MNKASEKTISIEVSENKIRIMSDYWETCHDIDRGGALSEITFKKGRSGNLLATPLEMELGNYLDTNERQPSVRIEDKHDEILLVFSGYLRDEYGRGNIEYVQAWGYRDYGIHRVQKIYAADGIVDLSGIVLAKATINQTFPMLLVDAGKQEWHDIRDLSPKTCWHCTPSSFGLFAGSGEGIQFIRGDDIWNWGYDACERQNIYGSLSCYAVANGTVCFELAPWKMLTGANMENTYKRDSVSFESFLGLTNYKSSPYLPYREVAICSQPFPSDMEIRDFSRMGINVIRIHEGANYVNNTIDHWMDGIFPPYEGEQLTEMKRIIRTAHIYGIKVIPYFMPQGAHPLSTAFKEHAREWQKMRIPSSVMKFAALGDGQVWETYFCLQSQWHTWMLEHVTRVMDEYGFDGMYFDSAAALAPCFHPAHGRTPHACEEAFLNFLSTLKKRFPDKPIFHHQMSTDINLLHANLVDHIINMEEFGLKTPDELRPMPFGLVVQRACASVGPVPQPFIPKDGEAVSSALEMVKYKPGKEPCPTRELARRGLPYFIVHGAVPYIYTWMEKVTLGYTTARDRLEDKEGFYHYYRLLKVLDNYRFIDYFAPAEMALSTGCKDIHVAVLKHNEGWLILLAYVGDASKKNIDITVDERYIYDLRPETWINARIIPSDCEDASAVGVALTGRGLTIKEISSRSLCLIEVGVDTGDND
ncbi:MAG: DUF6259 domain-containing protein [bacterium]|nr:DUF6259 domain-containing protein [bacterium]